MWCRLHDLHTGGREGSRQLSWRPEGDTCHHWGLLVSSTCSPSHLRGQQKQTNKKKECTATKCHPLLLSLLWEHTQPAAATAKRSGQHPDAQSLSLPKTLQLGTAGAEPPVCDKQDGVLLAWPTGGWGKPQSYL